MLFLEKYSPHLYAVLRIVAGLLFACRGAQKLIDILGGAGDQPEMGVPLFSLMGLAGIIELCGGLLIAVGWLTRYAAFIASGQMAVAYFMAHFPRSFWPMHNGGELAVLYCFIFLAIAAHGAGIWSIDGTSSSGQVASRSHL